MKELGLRLTNQSHVPRLELGGNFMSDAGVRTEESPSVEAAAARVKRALEAREVKEEKREGETISFEGLESPLEARRKVERDKILLGDKKARDEYFDRFFNLIDQTPHEFFDQVFNRDLRRIYEYEDFIKLISNGAIGENDYGLRIDDEARRQLEADLRRYQAERQMRQYLHDVNAAIYIPSLKAKQLFEHMQNFDSKLADLAWRTPGVVQMASIYEQLLREDMAKNDGYLRPEAVLGKVDTKEVIDPKNGEKKIVVINVERGVIEDEARRRFLEMVDRGEIVTKNEKGKTTQMSRDDFKTWQVDKTFTLARGMSIVNLRLVSLAAESRLPKETGRYTSLFLQDIIASYSPFIHLLGKFQIAGKGMSPYLYKDDKRAKILGLFSQWDPKSLKHVLDTFEGDGFDAIVNSPEFFYIQKLNPNRCGDIFTWLSWRASDSDSVASMMQRFVERGKINMESRRGVKPSQISEEDFINEYSNWIGTGLRFERLRGDLEKLDPDKSWKENRIYLNGKIDELKRKIERPDKKGHHHKEAKKDLKNTEAILKAMDKADVIFESMVRLQPHRLYLKSRDIRNRINKALGLPEGKLTKPQEENLTKILENLAIVEADLLKNRENYLNDGKLFDKLSLRLDLIQDEHERAYVRNFLDVFAKDFSENRNEYYKEFVFRREYKHGYILWDGDAPKDEFNFTALGPTGVVRRARDNAANEEGWTEEIKLLDTIEHIKNPEDLLKALETIHKKIDDFDKAKAMIDTAEKAEAFAQFFAEASITKWPLIGVLEKFFGRETSMAKIVFGKEAPAWSSTELRYFFEQLRSKQLINEEQYKRLYNKFSTMPDVVVDFGVSWLQFLFLLVSMYIITKLMKEK